MKDFRTDIQYLSKHPTIFQAVYKTRDGLEHEVEGNWPGLPEQWENWSLEGRYDWVHQLARSVGMSKDGIVQRVLVDE